MTSLITVTFSSLKHNITSTISNLRSILSKDFNNLIIYKIIIFNYYIALKISDTNFRCVNYITFLNKVIAFTTMNENNSAVSVLFYTTLLLKHFTAIHSKYFKI